MSSDFNVRNILSLNLSFIVEDKIKFIEIMTMLMLYIRVKYIKQISHYTDFDIKIF